MAQCEQYEVWILNGGEWMFKSSWQDVDVGLAAAQVQSVPVRIIRVVYGDDGVVERNVVAELKATRTNASAMGR